MKTERKLVIREKEEGPKLVRIWFKCGCVFESTSKNIFRKEWCGEPHHNAFEMSGFV